MNKAFLKKLHKEKRKAYKESWLNLFKEVAPAIGDKALQVINDKDNILKQIYELGQKDKEDMQEVFNAYGESLDTELGFNPDLISAWTDWMKQLDYETIYPSQPDYDRHPDRLPLPPEDPTQAYEITNAWTYSNDWQGYYRAKARYFLAVAVKLWKEKQ